MKTNLHHTILALVAAGCTALTTLPSHASGIPTFDIATVTQLQQQYMQLQQEFEVLKQQYGAVTGSYGRGVALLNESVNSASVVPGSWQEVVAMQQSGAFSGKQNAVEQLIKTMPQQLFQNPQGQTAATYKLGTDAVRAGLAGGEALYSEVQTHLNNLAKLAQAVDTTANVKDAQDLQNRIAVENGMLNSAMAKLTVMNVNLNANLLNAQNQATAANQNFFK